MSGSSSFGSYTVDVAPSTDGGDRVPDLSPREAFERWLAKLRVSKTDATVSSYHYRLKHFVEWCEDARIVSMAELTGWNIESYETHRREQGLEPISLKNELMTLRSFFKYCARIDLVDESLPDKVEPPIIERSEQVSKTKLHPDDARALIEYYADHAAVRGTRAHALLALAWFTGARLGGLRGLDLDDYNSDEQYVEFYHRPSEGTPLKNGLEGERVVGLPAVVCDAVDEYIETHRLETHDDHGRQPLLTSQLGRGSTNGVRGWMYLATVPCIHTDCPHGRDPKTCDFLEYTEASKCPSSRSPHQVRTGSITWQLNRGIPIDRVAERVNTSVSVLKRHYDQQSKLAEMRERRRQFIDRLDFNGGDADEE